MSGQMKYIKTGLAKEKPQPHQIQVPITPHQRKFLEGGGNPHQMDPTPQQQQFIQMVQNGAPPEMIQKLAAEIQGDANAGAQGQVGSRKYTGGVATGYDEKRKDSPKWKREQEIIENLLSSVPAGSRMLDVPTGTGRLIERANTLGLIYTGMDVSAEMLDLAAKKVADPNKTINDEKAWSFVEGNVLDGVPYDTNHFDVVTCIRLTRWIAGDHGEAGIRDLVAELCRVSKDRVILTARIKNHPVAVPLSLIMSAMPQGWSVWGKHEVEEDYFVIELRFTADASV